MKTPFRTEVLFLLVITLLHFSASPSSAQSIQGGGIVLQPFVSGFESPVQLVDPGDGSGRLFVVEQVGRIRIVQNGSLLPGSFLDISREIRYGGEQGLLSLAFHPNFSRNGKFYVLLNDRQRNVSVWSYRVSRNGNVAEPSSVSLIDSFRITTGAPYSLVPIGSSISASATAGAGEILSGAPRVFRAAWVRSFE